MCGIVAVIRKDGEPAAKAVLRRFAKQRSRGYQGFGYVAFNKDGQFVSHQRARFEHEIEKTIKKEKASGLIFHHRFPTSTPNTAAAAHPICINDKRFKYIYYVVHNGVINNADTIAVQQEKQGYKYTTEVITEYKTALGSDFAEIAINDSEVMAYDLVEVLEGLKPSMETRGSCAVIALQVERKGGKVVAYHFGRNHRNPLYMVENDQMVTLTSESKDKNAKECEPDKLYTVTADGTRSSRKLDIASFVSMGSYGGTSTHTHQHGARTHQTPMNLPARTRIGFSNVRPSDEAILKTPQGARQVKDVVDDIMHSRHRVAPPARGGDIEYQPSEDDNTPPAEDVFPLGSKPQKIVELEVELEGVELSLQQVEHSIEWSEKNFGQASDERLREAEVLRERKDELETELLNAYNAQPSLGE